jgi:hypothetical protein
MHARIYVAFYLPVCCEAAGFCHMVTSVSGMHFADSGADQSRNSLKREETRNTGV